MINGMKLEVADVDTEHGQTRKYVLKLVDPPGIGLIDQDFLKVLSLYANAYRLKSIRMLNHQK